MTPKLDSFWEVVLSDLFLRVRVTPNASRDDIEGTFTDAGLKTYLKVKVRAVPEKGKANKSVIALVAKTLGVTKSSVTVVKGDTDRVKTLQIIGGAYLADRLDKEFGGKA